MMNAMSTWVSAADRPATTTLTAIVVSYWTGSVLFECLDSLVGEPLVSQVVVVNNGNSAADTENLERYCRRHPRVQVLNPGWNTGFSVGCNFGAAYATGDYLALVNPDLVVPKGSFVRFLEVFATHERAWLCGGRLENIDGTEQRGGRREILTPWRALNELLRIDRLFPRSAWFRRLHLHEHEDVTEIIEVPTISGAFMIMPRRVFQRLGGMDDNMFMHFEDADLCLRVRQAGGQVLYCGHIPLRHHLSTSDVSRLFVQWHKTRSTCHYFYKHFSHNHPHGVLLLVNLALWLRLLLLLPRLALTDLPGLIRRSRRQARPQAPARTGLPPSAAEPNPPLVP